MSCGIGDDCGSAITGFVGVMGTGGIQFAEVSDTRCPTSSVSTGKSLVPVTGVPCFAGSLADGIAIDGCLYLVSKHSMLGGWWIDALHERYNHRSVCSCITELVHSQLL